MSIYMRAAEPATGVFLQVELREMRQGVLQVLQQDAAPQDAGAQVRRPCTAYSNSPLSWCMAVLVCVESAQSMGNADVGVRAGRLGGRRWRWPNNSSHTAQ
jgi:hypothetical protein